MAALQSPLTQPDWQVSPGLTPYGEALREMDAHVERMLRQQAGERVWLVEHEAVITAGTSSAAAELVDSSRFPVVEAGRGGRFTYHGPGQRVIYPMLDLGRRGRDVHRYVSSLEQWAIAALGEFAIRAFPHEAGTGIWVDTANGIAKIGAIGVRVRRWISFHGLAINVATDLSHYGAIIPCGISAHGVARLADLAPGASLADLDAALLRHLPSMLTSLTGCRASTMKALEAEGDCS
ncbi:lipoyl(octanoyl) transferase LipB [Sandaracinobacter sp. RS1-74]|uniref:lipoyl(octanoyl) transferase LipB n=1 Tax=Sandaracinobacteroides sayramensis TaxID=2913411 RepID=UPI001EDBF7CD|nr:lipoyl(octanoyl) transferase LipB [Sandaracinobacteroides sayramensis]MCG2839746.1 lipoyl(octanoyl) transferase LipB [Sandaracinobacteroides sayramensis]